MNNKSLMRTIYSTFFATTFLLAATLTIYSQEKWENIPYQKWGKNELKAVLSDSPWAKQFEASINLSKRLGTREFSRNINALILLRSALPIRQALLRQRQLDLKYDKMNESQKLDFDKENLALIECMSCNEFYSVSVISSFQYVWEGVPSDELRKLFYLSNENDERRYLSRVFAPSSREMIFLFPKFDEKKEPLLTEKNKKLIFHSGLYATSPDQPGFFSKVEFDVIKIIRNGKVSF